MSNITRRLSKGRFIDAIHVIKKQPHPSFGVISSGLWGMYMNYRCALMTAAQPLVSLVSLIFSWMEVEWHQHSAASAAQTPFHIQTPVMSLTQLNLNDLLIINLNGSSFKTFFKYFFHSAAVLPFLTHFCVNQGFWASTWAISSACRHRGFWFCWLSFIHSRRQQSIWCYVRQRCLQMCFVFLVCQTTLSFSLFSKFLFIMNISFQGLIWANFSL